MTKQSARFGNLHARVTLADYTIRRRDLPMTDLTDARPSPDAEPVSASHARNRCAHCGGPFGLIRRRRAGRQFCCAFCVEAYDDAMRRSVQAKARWLDLVDRARQARER
jgi:hypothetical protein